MRLGQQPRVAWICSLEFDNNGAINIYRLSLGISHSLLKFYECVLNGSIIFFALSEFIYSGYDLYRKAVVWSVLFPFVRVM